MPELRQPRATFIPQTSVSHFWASLGLPWAKLNRLVLPEDGPGLPSSFKVGHLAQACIALAASTATLVYSERTSSPSPCVTVAPDHAVAEFKSVELHTIDGVRPYPARAEIGGLHKTLDGYVRIHDSFINHREAIKKLLGCQGADDRDAIARAVRGWKAIQLESAAIQCGAVVAALRTMDEWAAHPQAKATPSFEILLEKIAEGSPGIPVNMRSAAADKCLRGVRVVEMTRVIAAPVAGRTLAAHGANVIWVTSPNLPDLPELDRDMARGKRTVSLDIDDEHDLNKLKELLEDANVFIQSYRPGSLAAKGLDPMSLARTSKTGGIIWATLSAYGPDGPWARRRGFDSLVQTCTGLNASEAEHHGHGEEAKVLPCQALDHASGYLLAAGINAALYKQITEGGSYKVEVCLAGTAAYLASLGRLEGHCAFSCKNIETQDDVAEDVLETRDSTFGKIRAVKHAARIEGLDVGYEIMPKPLGSDKPTWT
ncbi:hypothetical protein MRB53_036870 [Persea americana]|nr:hypothetical protein MRB53_036870 [Persea americana]